MVTEQWLNAGRTEDMPSWIWLEVDEMPNIEFGGDCIRLDNLNEGDVHFVGRSQVFGMQGVWRGECKKGTSLVHGPGGYF